MNFDNITILLADLPPILRELVNRLANEQPDITILGEVAHPLDVLLAVRRMEPNVVVLAMGDDRRSSLSTHLLSHYPDLTLVLLSPDGSAACIEQLRVWRCGIAVRNADVFEALREAIRATRAGDRPKHIRHPQKIPGHAERR